MKAALLIPLLAGCAAPSPSGPAALQGRVFWKNSPLPNVFVYVKEGLGSGPWQPPREPVLLDQRGFEFTPRVFGVCVGQPLRITSSDFSPHNVHCQPIANEGFNVGLLQDESITRVFTKPEIMVPFVCNLHPTMRAYVGVVEHPYFAVTAFDGTFALPPLPPGTYTVATWDEWHGATRTRVNVPADAGLELRY